MANSKLEAQFITAVLQGKITLKETVKLGLSERHFSVFADTFDFIREYERQYGKLPSEDIVQVKNSAYKPIEPKDDPKEILKAIKESNLADLFYTELQRSIKLLQETGSVVKARNYLSSKMGFFRENDDDVFELTSPEFTAGEEDYQKRRKAFLEHGVYGIPSGFGKEFDDHLNGGWIDGNLYGIAGSSGFGKSWLAQVVSNTALGYGKNVLYAALEGTLSKEYYRFLTVSTEALNTQLQRGEIDEKEFRWIQTKMREQFNKVGGKLYLALHGNRDEYTPGVLRDKIELYKPNLVIADYLTLFSDGSGQDNWETYLKVSKSFKNLATQYNIPFIAILQGTISSLMGEKMTGADVAQSKGVIRDFDHIIGISKIKDKKNIVRVNTMKMRDNESDFDAFYQTGWNTGKLKFLENVGDSDGSF